MVIYLHLVDFYMYIYIYRYIVNVGKYTIHVLDFHSCTHLAPIATGFDFTPSLFPQFAFRGQISPAGLGDLWRCQGGVASRKRKHALDSFSHCENTVESKTSPKQYQNVLTACF